MAFPNRPPPHPVEGGGCWPSCWLWASDGCSTPSSTPPAQRPPLGEELRSHTITLDRAARSFVRLIEQIDTADRSELASIITQSRESIGAVTVGLEQSEDQDSSLVILLGISLDFWDEGLERFENAFLVSGGTTLSTTWLRNNSPPPWSVSEAATAYTRHSLERIGAEPGIQSFSEFRTVVFLPVVYPVVDTAQFLATFARLSRPTLEFNRRPGNRAGHLPSRVGIRPGGPPGDNPDPTASTCWWWWPTGATWRWSKRPPSS